jgi:hypothetical protein
VSVIISRASSPDVPSKVNLAPKPKFVIVQPTADRTYLLYIPVHDREGDPFKYIWPTSCDFELEPLEEGKAQVTVHEGVEKLDFMVKIRDEHGAVTDVKVSLAVVSEE